ncbi:MAG: carbohydrate ABC transporter permease [Clostridia bacterium]|nr:carbohydrate ABC transporter permease [Clostridia bacterium]
MNSTIISQKKENQTSFFIKEKSKQYALKAASYFVLILTSLAVLVPFLWMLSASIKLDNDVFEFPVRWIPENPRWENYKEIWEILPFSIFYKNTAILAVTITVLSLITSSLAAYAFSKIKFPGRNAIFICYIGTIAVPFQVYMIPQFIMMRKLNLTDTLLSLILLQSFSAFGVFLFRQFFISIPEELSESARMDGLSEFGIYLRIILPLAKPAIATLTIFQFVFVWNNFLEPLVYLTSTDKKTLQLGIRMFMTQYTADYALIMAATVVSLIPVVILFFSMQRFFIEGIATTGIKG